MVKPPPRSRIACADPQPFRTRSGSRGASVVEGSVKHVALPDRAYLVVTVLLTFAFCAICRACGCFVLLPVLMYAVACWLPSYSMVGIPGRRLLRGVLLGHLLHYKWVNRGPTRKTTKGGTAKGAPFAQQGEHPPAAPHPLVSGGPRRACGARRLLGPRRTGLCFAARLRLVRLSCRVSRVRLVCRHAQLRPPHPRLSTELADDIICAPAARPRSLQSDAGSCRRTWPWSSAPAGGGAGSRRPTWIWQFAAGARRSAGQHSG